MRKRSDELQIRPVSSRSARAYANFQSLALASKQFQVGSRKAAIATETRPAYGSSVP